MKKMFATLMLIGIGLSIYAAPIIIEEQNPQVKIIKYAIKHYRSLGLHETTILLPTRKASPEIKQYLDRNGYQHQSGDYVLVVSW